MLLTIAGILAAAPPDIPWSLEAECRHALRRRSILTEGAPWREADAKAAELVRRAREANGTPEPAGWDAERAAGSCAVCGGELEPRPNGGGNKLYCGYRCQRVAMNAMVRERREEGKPFEITCTCGKVFPRNPKSKKPQLYCSNACKLRAYRKRKAA